MAVGSRATWECLTPEERRMRGKAEAEERKKAVKRLAASTLVCEALKQRITRLESEFQALEAKLRTRTRALRASERARKQGNVCRYEKYLAARKICLDAGLQ